MSRDEDGLLYTLTLDVLGQVSTLMGRQKVTQAELARRMGVQKEYVSRLFRDTPNLTLRTLVRMFNALDARAEIRAVAHRTAAKRIAPSITAAAKRVSVG
jgi:transcriptional regulator with XRE-family HTH domain